MSAGGEGGGEGGLVKRGRIGRRCGGMGGGDLCAGVGVAKNLNGEN